MTDSSNAPPRRLFHPDFRAGAQEGFRVFLPLSIGLVPWALVTGVSMASTGFTPLQAMGMNIIVFAGAAQLGTLPLIAGGAPVWLIVAAALAINLRFLIFSAAIAQGFRGVGARGRWVCGHLLTDGVFAVTLDKMLHTESRDWRLGYFLAPSLWSWVLWQAFALIGIIFSGSIPKSWSLEFMATIALMLLLIPMAKARPMLVSALAGGGVAVALHALPLRLGLFVGILTGILAGFAAEHWQHPRGAHGARGASKERGGGEAGGEPGSESRSESGSESGSKPLSKPLSKPVSKLGSKLGSDSGSRSGQ